ncbi:hypothetical protein B484DRAFT_406653 [Ochromonadaceae sp. CCMP2298]|nr:hypothetical protein B484DRAFT_406653 [Ochromonadaceae sp. CCMP2298]
MSKPALLAGKKGGKRPSRKLLPLSTPAAPLSTPAPPTDKPPTDKQLLDALWKSTESGVKSDQLVKDLGWSKWQWKRLKSALWGQLVVHEFIEKGTKHNWGKVKELRLVKDDEGKVKDNENLKEFIMNCSQIIKTVGGQLENSNNPRSRQLAPIDNTTSGLTPLGASTHQDWPTTAPVGEGSLKMTASPCGLTQLEASEGSLKMTASPCGLTQLEASEGSLKRTTSPWKLSSTAPLEESCRADWLATFLASSDSDEGSTAMVESPSGSVVTSGDAPLERSDSAEHGLFVNLSQDCPETDLLL